MMNRRSLMISTMLMSAVGVSGVVGFSGNVWAADVQCLKTPSCEELGYTEVSCIQNNGVKCPYGDKYFCVCPMNYKFSCTGENEVGGVGDACNGKYTSCSCSGGLMWGDGACVENCPIGSILFNDFTCSDDVVSGKTPIAIVVYKDGKGGGQALALKSIGNYEWGGYGKDIPTLPNITSSEAASKDYASCENSAKIRAQGNNSTYPAVWAANGYSTEGTSAGDWCLPAAGIFTSYYNNQTAINLGFEKAGGTTFTTSTYAWSSSEYSSGGAWYSRFNYSYGLLYDGKDGSFEVRPVVGFCDDAKNYIYDTTTDSCVKDGCQLGSIFYSDKTCSMKLKDGKTPIGVVVYVDENGANAQVMALKSIGSYQWSTEYVDITSLPNYTSSEAASKDVASCENSKKIMATGNKSKYPAVWAVNEYSTEGTSAGDWCLPAAGIITSYYNNKDAINLSFTKVGETKFTESTYVWSSSEDISSTAWYSTFSYNNGLSTNGKRTSHEVRPVLEGNIASEGGEICTNSYQYTCGGENETGGEGDSCGGKFSSCTCADGYGWGDGACAVCDTSYQYSCDGVNETGGDGESCSGKYAACTCAEGYKWENGSCVELPWGKCTGLAASCSLGNILFSDGTCSANAVSGKTPIAVVVYKSSDGNCGQAMTLKSLGNYQGSTEYVDISTLPNKASSEAASKDYDSCGNTAKIITAGNKSTYPAAWVAYEYKTEGTKAGDWCLPAAGIFTSYYNNQSVINTGFTRAKGTKFTTSTYAWSSSEYSYNGAWYSGFSNSYGLTYYKSKVSSYEVRPVIEF